MRGQGRSNELARIDDADFHGIWRGVMNRLGEIREYRDMFEEAYPGTRFNKMNLAHATNAIAGFFVQDLSFNDTPWDRFLAGDDRALSKDQLDGAKTFLTLKCSVCHNGASLSDGRFHNVELAAPYGHAGQFSTLRGFIAHYSRSDDALIDQLTTYMTALTDPAARHINRLAPSRVPSSLPVDR